MNSYYKTEERLASFRKVIKMEDIIMFVEKMDKLVEERNLEKLKSEYFELYTKKYSVESFKTMEPISRNYSHTGWGVPTNMIRSEELKLFDECVYWRNGYIDLIIEYI